MHQNGNARLDPGKPGHSKFPLSRRGIIGVSAIGAMLVAAVILAISLTGGGHSTGFPPAAAGGRSQTATGGQNGANSASASRLPVLAGAPQIAVMPKGAGHSGKPKATGSPKPSSSAGAHPSPSASSSAPSNSPTPTPPPVNSGNCTHPQLVTSDPNGMLSESPYFVAQDMWNASGYSVSQTLYACSYSSWYVSATMNNNSGDGAVKTYPNAHMDFDSSPKISSFSKISSTFAESGGGSGIYEYAYDIWLNGIATSGSTEVMIWNDNHGQSPGGSYQETVSLAGYQFKVYSSGSYIALVSTGTFKSGTVDLLAIFKWLMSKNMIPSNTTMGQVDYGVELVSTNNAPETFSINNFSVSTS